MIANALNRLNPNAAYILAEQQKQQSADQFFAQIVEIYRSAKKNGQYPLGADQNVVDEFVASVDSRLPVMPHRQPPLKPFSDDLDRAVKFAYREIATKYGLKRVDPKSPNFESDMNEFHENYLTNFPIPSEQESKEGFIDLLKAGTRQDGYEERAYSLVCPLTGRYLMGVNFAIQPPSNSIHFTYGFVMPWARGNIGFSRALIDVMTNAGAEHIAKYPKAFEGKPLITFEKNILAEMTLGDILMDTAGIDIHNPPNEGADLHLSSIGQSMRDLIWKQRGGKIVSFNYIQSSLEGVVSVGNPADEKLAIRFLNKDASLTAGEKTRAESIMGKAVGEKEPGCNVLNLCVFVPAGTDQVSVAQIKKAMTIFQGTSVVKDPANIENDIYFKAMMADLESKAKGGMIALADIKPYGGDIPAVNSFRDAEELTKLLLKNVSWEELRANADRPYAEWVAEKTSAVAPAFAAYKAAANENVTEPARGAGRLRQAIQPQPQE
jgi:hypothetical protein